jgi:hypothetical protein
VEHERAVHGHDDAGEEADARAEHRAAERADQAAVRRPERDLRQPGEEIILPEEAVEEAEDVRVEGRLVERRAAEEVAAGDGARPLVVHPGLDDRVGEAGVRPDLEEIDEADHERQEEDGEGAGEEAPLAACERGREAARPSPGGAGRCHAKGTG